MYTILYIYLYNILLFSILSSSLSTSLRGIFEHHTTNRGMTVRGKPRLPWLLLLVAVTVVLPTNADYNENGIRLIVQNVLSNDLLADFPRSPGYLTGRQFAIIILISQQDYANGNTNINLTPEPTNINIDNRYPVQPGPELRVNYMVARPDTPREAGHQREHAEKKLLVNTEQLLQTFQS